ncbi:L,D-transpeptidase [Sulfurivirga sp.]|uniref:L,D-transpeptidase n=1 Tax=Sulfurivirga sp. TaxID=2614236 RepID=UPI0025DCF746|nr:L,D-transpeptidase [Sulfurivirga sp.]
MSDKPFIHVSIARQRLQLREGRRVLCEYPVSTARAGVNCRENSGGTPVGRLRVMARIGAGAPLHAVFVGRRPTGEIWTPALSQAAPQRDWILGRILWLGGMDWGRNRGGGVDTLRRYIYIHGTPPAEPLGVPASHGCIRMACEDVAALFDRVPVGTAVRIVP